MTTAYTPIVGVGTRTVELPTQGVQNLPPVGTRIRATLGESVLVGTIYKDESSYALIPIRVDGTDWAHEGCVEFSLWIGAGWQFEVLDDSLTASLEAGYDLTEAGVVGSLVSA